MHGSLPLRLLIGAGEEAEERHIAPGVGAIVGPGMVPALALILILVLIVAVVVIGDVTGFGFGGDTDHRGAIGGHDGAIVRGAGKGDGGSLTRGRDCGRSD